VLFVINKLQKQPWKVNKTVLNFILNVVKKKEIITDAVVTDFEIEGYKKKLNWKEIEKLKKE
jgi:hypothetical protein